MLALLRKFVRNQTGLETLEWAIVSGLIVGGVIAACTAIGLWVTGRFETLANALK